MSLTVPLRLSPNNVTDTVPLRLSGNNVTDTVPLRLSGNNVTDTVPLRLSPNNVTDTVPLRLLRRVAVMTEEGEYGCGELSDGVTKMHKGIIRKLH